MIKINLLNSVTERQGSTVMAVDRKVGSPGSRLLLLTLAVGFLTAAVIGWDVISTQMALADAVRRFEEQKQIEKELESVIKEQKELEEKIAAIDKRIAAIKKLRDEQKGPSAVLEAMRERIAMVPGIYLKSIEQKGEQVLAADGCHGFRVLSVGVESVPTTTGRAPGCRAVQTRS